MLVVLALVLFETVTGSPAPTPTPLAIGRSTPVPAGSGSLQDLARRRRGITSEAAPHTGSGGVSVAEGTAGPLRHEGLSGRPVEEGLLVEGKIVNKTDWQKVLALEVSATRRNGTTVRGLLCLDPVPAGGERQFSRLLNAPGDPSDPASLKPETARARMHLLPHPEFTSLEGQDYLRRIECLNYWGKSLRSPKAKEDDQVEVHVQNSCSWAVQDTDTWFAIRIDVNNVDIHNVYGRFLEAVAPHGELIQFVPVSVPKGRRWKVAPWRLREIRGEY